MCLGNGPVYAVGDTGASLTICFATGSSFLTFWRFLGFISASGLDFLFMADCLEFGMGSVPASVECSSFFTCVTGGSLWRVARVVLARREDSVIEWMAKGQFYAADAAMHMQGML